MLDLKFRVKGLLSLTTYTKARLGFETTDISLVALFKRLAHLKNLRSSWFQTELFQPTMN